MSRGLRRYIPPQHGAWAMLLLPYLVGLVVAGPHWLHAPVLVAWLAGYLLSYYALQAVKTRRPGRVRPQLVAYGAVTAAAAAVVLAVRPDVLVFAPAYAALLAVNTWYAWRRRERALLNDLASVVLGCLMVPVAATLSGPPLGLWPLDLTPLSGAGAQPSPAVLVAAFAVVLGYFAGTVFYVKTMIRERGNTAFRRWSVAYHTVALAAFLAAAVVAPAVAGWRWAAVAGVFAALLARAWVLPGRRLSPKHVGMIEIGFCTLLLGAVAVLAA